MNSVIFDVDQTLVDTSMLEPLRAKHQWSSVFRNLHLTYLYDDMRKVFDFIEGSGAKITLVSNSPRSYVQNLARYHNIPHHHIVAYEDTVNHKPYPDPMLLALSLMNETSNHVVAFGDSLSDMIAAKAANIDVTVGCLWGSSERDKLLQDNSLDCIFWPIEIMERVFLYSYSGERSYYSSNTYLKNTSEKLGVPFHFFFYYTNNEDSNFVSKESLEIRNEIWDFKEGRNTDQWIDIVEQWIRCSFKNPKELTFVCIPASTKQKNEIRYRHFSERLCKELGMQNAFDQIFINQEKVPTHLGGTERGAYSAYPDFFKGKKILLFDDIVTTGRSMKTFIKGLEKFGAKVVCCM